MIWIQGDSGNDLMHGDDDNEDLMEVRKMIKYLEAMAMIFLSEVQEMISLVAVQGKAQLLIFN